MLAQICDAITNIAGATLMIAEGAGTVKEPALRALASFAQQHQPQRYNAAFGHNQILATDSTNFTKSKWAL
jgi:hypothetical protein